MREYIVSISNSNAITATGSLGYVDESNATVLSVRLGGEMLGNDIDFYVLCFSPCDATGNTYAEKLVSGRISTSGTADEGYVRNGCVYYRIPSAVTRFGRLKFQLEAYRLKSDGSVASITKSKMLVLEFEDSVTGECGELNEAMGNAVESLINLSARATSAAEYARSAIDEMHTHPNQTVLDKLGESAEGKAEYNSEVLFSAMRVDTVDDLPENPVLGDLCYVRNGTVRSEKLLLETGEEYGALYFAAYPELGTAPFSWVMSTDGNTVEVSFEPENGILIVSVNGVAAYVYNKTGSAVTVAGLYNEKDCVFPAGWSRLDTDTLILSSDGEFYSGTSLAPGGDYSLLASRFFPGCEIVSVTSGGKAVQSIEQNVLATRACFAQMNSGYWCCTEQGWKNTLLGKLSGSADAGTLFFGGGWIDMMRIVTNTFTPNAFTNAPGISEVTQEGAFTVDENGNLLYENKLLATRTQKLAVTSAAYAAEVSATAIPAVEADPGNGVEAQEAVEGYYTISPNVMYDFGETTSLNLQLAPGVGGYVNEYMFRFSCGETAATFALPDCIEWIGSEPEMVANKIYECSIVDNRAVIA